MTEGDWAYKNGFYKIWDCGKKRWILSLSPLTLPT